MTDTLLSPIMDALRLCTCAELAGTLGGPPSCACVLMPGTVAPADRCGCKGPKGCGGMAWVRLVRAYPTSAFPSQDNRPANCSTGLAAVLEVGVYRCVPVPDAKGNPPAPEAQTQAALVQADDMLALARAIGCCEAITSREHTLGVYTPADGGGCGGGTWQVTVLLTPTRPVSQPRSTARGPRPAPDADE